MSGVGALLGLVFGAGAHLIVACPTPWRARRFVLRVDAYLHPRRLSRWEPVLHRLGSARLDSIAERQRGAGQEPDPTAHLLGVAVWCAGGLGLGAGIVALLLASASVRQPLAAAALLTSSVLLGWLLAERRLDAAVRRRRRTAALELPSVAETLSLTVAAGAALPHGMELLVRRGGGVLVEEFAHVIADMRRGEGMDRALAALCERLPVVSVCRFIDALRIALERGTPIVDVLHAQAADARHETRRLLLEQAGRREIAMLVPVVFFVLPTIVVVALYPGFTELGALTQPL